VRSRPVAPRRPPRCRPRRGSRDLPPSERNGRLEPPKIQLDPLRLHPEEVAVDGEQVDPFAGVVFAQGLPELAEDAAQVCTGGPLLALWPKELGQFPPVARPFLGGQVAKKRESLLPPGPQGPPLEAHLRETQQPDAQGFCLWDHRFLIVTRPIAPR
jgi:hypothetical protein